MNISLIFPDQLFESNPCLDKSNRIILLSHPFYFSKYSYNKKKLMLHIMSMEYYKNSLITKGFDVDIMEKKDFLLILDKKSNENHNIRVCENSNFEISSFLHEISLKNIQVKLYKSPMFYESIDDLYDYFGNKNQYLLSNFYKKVRRKHNILVTVNNEPLGGKWSYDSENRKKPPQDFEIPYNKKFIYNKKILYKAITTIKSNFINNIGSVDEFNFPVTRDQALQNLDFFLKNKFNKFGIYQDAIISSETFLLHSNLSSSLNIGLITPKEVIEKSINYAEINNIPINSLEGFVRQILGWREFIRGVYVNKSKDQYNCNFWNSNNDLPPSFYKAKTCIQPLDDSISKSIKNSYAHHIERLMIQGNIMLLLEINPKFVYQWFMEIYIDSAAWVMVPNVFGMSLYSDGGIMSTKPYISSSNYILKMSNYKKGEWSSVWDSLFWTFIYKHRAKITKINRMSFMLKILNNKSKSEMLNYHKISEKYLDSIY